MMRLVPWPMFQVRQRALTHRGSILSQCGHSGDPLSSSAIAGNGKTGSAVYRVGAAGKSKPATPTSAMYSRFVLATHSA
jgi:hypothetical protein